MSDNHPKSDSPQHVVIVGGGFAGLFAARALGRRFAKMDAVRVTLIDKRNFHTFQPLLYQVASGMLTTGDVCTPHRIALRHYPNIRCLTGAVYDIDAEHKCIQHEHGELHYDALIVATGVKHQYFGNETWAAHAPGLKTVEHALRMRRRIFHAFEMAELATSEAERRAWLTFVVVGAGPTGVELAGAIGELAHRTMVGDFRHIDPRDARIVLVEGADHVLPVYDAALAAKAQRMLAQLGVEVVSNTLVKAIDAQGVTMAADDEQHEQIASRTVLWAAGVKASAFGNILAQRLHITPGSAGRVPVNADLSLPQDGSIFVIGDLAACTDGNGRVVPGLAPAAIQQGEYVARLLQRRRRGQSTPAFAYHDRGSMAIIGRNRAVAKLPRLSFSGYPAWLAWVFIHIFSLIGTERRIRVMLQWAWKYNTRRTGDRLITGRPPDTQTLRQTRSAEAED